MRIFLFGPGTEHEIADGSWPSDEHQSWEWVKQHYSGRDDAEEHIKTGENVSVFVGPVVFYSPDGAVLPERR